MTKLFIVLIFLCGFSLTSCTLADSNSMEESDRVVQTAETFQISRTPTPVDPRPSPTPTKTLTLVPSELQPTTTPAPPAPFEYQGSEPPCGLQLPILSTYDGPTADTVDPNLDDLAALEEIMPESFRPVVDYILENPASVGFVAFQAGREEEGIYVNADVPMPLASVVKIIHLVAYAEAISSGELIPTTTVYLDEIDAYYLPTTDLGTHLRSIEDLRDNGRVFGSPEAILLTKFRD